MRPFPQVITVFLRVVYLCENCTRLSTFQQDVRSIPSPVASPPSYSTVFSQGLLVPLTDGVGECLDLVVYIPLFGHEPLDLRVRVDDRGVVPPSELTPDLRK